ncbi:hypothetical protein [Salirhabdus sp. Marseille-P4669]|uniref:hypothetical protein n=1 Tax=Salirhabdus sp. Marseille-P4669 TaxID=2042310 RepID=UPI0011AFA23F|nr:hypothetical protein [Salirhabdus sp. Marseille-P4669]
MALLLNIVPSLKYPDSTIQIVHLLASLFVLLALLLYTKVGTKNLFIFSIFGIISGLFIYLIKMFESTITTYPILDALASIQYLFYVVFTTPLFGINVLLDLNYAMFSLVISVVYVVAFVCCFYFNKKREQI